MSSTEIATIPGPQGTQIYSQGEFVAVRQMAGAMGLDWNGQRQLIERSPWSGTWTCKSHVQLPGDTQAREHYFLHRRRVPMWVANISTGHIKDETVKATVIQWQNEIADVLADYYEGKLGKAQTSKPALFSIEGPKQMRFGHAYPTESEIKCLLSMGASKIPTKYGAIEFDRSSPEYAFTMMHAIVNEAISNDTSPATEELRSTIEEAKVIRTQLEMHQLSLQNKAAPLPAVTKRGNSTDQLSVHFEARDK